MRRRVSVRHAGGRNEGADKKEKLCEKAGYPSIYFLLWAAFSAFSLLIVLLFGFMQNIMLKQSYKSEIAYNLAEQGKAIRQELGNYDGRFYSAFVRYLAQRYDVGVYILDADGNVVFPVEEDSETDFTESFDFPEKVARLMEQLASAENGEVLYEDPSGEYVYGSELIAYVGTEETQTLYLYVFKPLKLVENVTSEMNIRTMLLAIFVLVLSFAVSSAISGVLTKPITEMTQKAKQLAAGISRWISTAGHTAVKWSSWRRPSISRGTKFPVRTACKRSLSPTSRTISRRRSR